MPTCTLLFVVLFVCKVNQGISLNVVVNNPGYEADEPKLMSTNDFLLHGLLPSEGTHHVT